MRNNSFSNKFKGSQNLTESFRNFIQNYPKWIGKLVSWIKSGWEGFAEAILIEKETNTAEEGIVVSKINYKNWNSFY